MQYAHHETHEVSKLLPNTKSLCRAEHQAEAESVAPDQDQQAEAQQALPEKPKAKRLLLSAQQIGYRPGAARVSPRLLPAWV